MAETETAESFKSLGELRTVHASLMRAVRSESRTSDLEKRVTHFLEKAEAAGRLIAEQNDRDSAQGVLDYWTAWRFSSADSESLVMAPPILDAFDASIVPVLTAENPFIGLRSFEEKDAARFTGRNEAIKSLLARLEKHPVAFVSGPLGSGKSSLVFAGIVPRLKSRAVGQTQKEPLLITVFPGADPLKALLAASYDALETVADKKNPAGKDIWIAEQQTKLQATGTLFGATLRALVPDRWIVLVVDQFEEVFTLCADPPMRDRFAQALASIAPDTQSHHRVILIIREDYAQPAYGMPALKAQAAELDSRFSPPPLTGTELILTITSAADAVGLKFDAGIVEDLAQDVAGDSALLPTLQFTLSKLWERRQGNRITRDVYNEVGRPRVALTRAAEAAYESLGESDRQLARKIFTELTEASVGNEVLRRRVRRDTLVHASQEPAASVDSVLETFVKAEMIRATKGANRDDDRFEVAHEILTHTWKRLGDWLKERGQISQKRLQLVTTGKLYQKERSTGYLLSGAALQEALPYRDTAPEIRDLVDASQANEKRQNHIRIAFIGGAFLLLASMGIFSFQSERGRRAEAEQALGRQTDLANQLIKSNANLEGTIKEREAAYKDVLVALNEQQKQIDNLRQNLARAARVAVPEEQISAAVAQVYKNQREPTATRDNAASSVPAGGQEGWVWIGSEQQPNINSAQTQQQVTPTATTIGGRYMMLRNVVLRKDKPSEAYSQSDSLAVVPQGTLVTALDKPVPYDRPGGTVQYWTRVRVDPSSDPIVYYQFANPGRPDGGRADAEKVATAIRSRGFRVPAVQALDLAKGQTEIRFYYPNDKAAADKLKTDLSKVLRDQGYPISTINIADLTAKRQPWNYPGVLELWLELPPPRQ